MAHVTKEIYFLFYVIEIENKRLILDLVNGKRSSVEQLRMCMCWKCSYEALSKARQSKADRNIVAACREILSGRQVHYSIYSPETPG